MHRILILTTLFLSSQLLASEVYQSEAETAKKSNFIAIVKILNGNESRLIMTDSNNILDARHVTPKSIEAIIIRSIHGFEQDQKIIIKTPHMYLSGGDPTCTTNEIAFVFLKQDKDNNLCFVGGSNDYLNINKGFVESPDKSKISIENKIKNIKQLIAKSKKIEP